ncbi:MAG: type II secretion system protein [Verrucomicrobia bacterium]|nr:type II secretion system protein [Verrucomicrobiota bacterium]
MTRLRDNLSKTPRGGFTLLELILSVGIALGLLAVALFFYAQSSRLRADLMEETGRIRVARLALDRIARELQAASPAAPFHGTATELSFASFEDRLPRSPDAPPAGSFRIRWSFPPDLSTGAVPALTWSVEPAVPPRASQEDAAAADTAMGLPAETPPDETTNAAPPQAGRERFETVQFARFRYFNGQDWVEEWPGPQPPSGVEITLAIRPLPDQADPAMLTIPEGLEEDVFRRVVALPAARAGAEAESAGSETPGAANPL